MIDPDEIKWELTYEPSLQEMEMRAYREGWNAAVKAAAEKCKEVILADWKKDWRESAQCCVEMVEALKDGKP